MSGLTRMTLDEVRESLRRACRLFEQSVGSRPLFAGAPGWQVTPRASGFRTNTGSLLLAIVVDRDPSIPGLRALVLKNAADSDDTSHLG